ncbi:MAG TPA: dihydroorotate dehydrogenase [Mycobacteriales bacterium]|nr:dihydroorotate dehydrogenase [Mycobacteriales bacterium]
MSVTLRPKSRTPRHVDVDMTTTLGSFVAPDPVFTASGCAAAGRELATYNDLSLIGGIVTKSIKLHATAGRATPRMAETPSGMLNSIGLQGPGVDVFISRDLAWLEEHDVRAVVSIAGTSVEDYGKLASKLRGKALSMIEVNISCPNVEDRGQVFACDPVAAADVITAVRRSSTPGVPIFAKLSPDVTDIVAIATACVEAGATGLSLINTTLGMVIDTSTMRPLLAGMTGGLSGPAIRPMALRCVWQVHAALPDIPLMGVGGIRTGLDAFQFILAGASAIQVGTVIFNDPGAPQRVSQELREVLVSRGLSNVAEAVGLAHRPRQDPPAPTVSEGPPVTTPPLADRDDRSDASNSSDIEAASFDDDLEVLMFNDAEDA